MPLESLHSLIGGMTSLGSLARRVESLFGGLTLPSWLWLLYTRIALHRSLRHHAEIPRVV